MLIRPTLVLKDYSLAKQSQTSCCGYGRWDLSKDLKEMREQTMWLSGVNWFPAEGAKLQGTRCIPDVDKRISISGVDLARRVGGQGRETAGVSKATLVLDSSILRMDLDLVGKKSQEK